MSFSKIIEKELLTYPVNEVFFASELYSKQFTEINELNYYKVLERLTKKREISKVSKGCYYIPRKSKFGYLPISENEVIRSVLKSNNGGFEVGYGLYNEIGLTTQITKNRVFYCNTIKGNKRKVKNTEFMFLNLEFNKDIVKIIQTLEVLQNYNKIEDLNTKMFRNYISTIKNFYNDNIVYEVLSYKTYKKSTIAFLKDILEYNQLSNNLDIYLSSLSSYNIPNWRE